MTKTRHLLLVVDLSIARKAVLSIHPYIQTPWPSVMDGDSERLAVVSVEVMQTLVLRSRACVVELIDFS